MWDMNGYNSTRMSMQLQIYTVDILNNTQLYVNVTKQETKRMKANITK
jgi:hypothetical protein